LLDGSCGPRKKGPPKLRPDIGAQNLTPMSLKRPRRTSERKSGKALEKVPRRVSVSKRGLTAGKKNSNWTGEKREAEPIAGRKGGAEGLEIHSWYTFLKAQARPHGLVNPKSACTKGQKITDSANLSFIRLWVKGRLNGDDR